MATILKAVALGMAALLVGAIPRNLLFVANLRSGRAAPWSVPILAGLIWLYWRYLRGDGPPTETSASRRQSLRSNPLPGSLWTLALLAGGLGLVALVFGLRVLNRLVVLPHQTPMDLGGIPTITILTILIASAAIAGIVEEASFRGYMQGPIEREHGALVAILITGTMFAVAHLDFTPVLWPYYVAVAAIYGMVTRLCDSIRPAIVLHFAGNVYSNVDLWLHGQAEWQATAGPAALVRATGPDPDFWLGVTGLAAATLASVLAYGALARAAARQGVTARGGLT